MHEEMGKIEKRKGKQKKKEKKVEVCVRSGDACHCSQLQWLVLMPLIEPHCKDCDLENGIANQMMPLTLVYCKFWAGSSSIDCSLFVPCMTCISPHSSFAWG